VKRLFKRPGAAEDKFTFYLIGLVYLRGGITNEYVDGGVLGFPELYC